MLLLFLDSSSFLWYLICGTLLPFWRISLLNLRNQRFLSLGRVTSWWCKGLVRVLFRRYWGIKKVLSGRYFCLENIWGSDVLSWIYWGFGVLSWKRICFRVTGNWRKFFIACGRICLDDGKTWRTSFRSWRRVALSREGFCTGKYWELRGLPLTGLWDNAFK